MRRLFLQVTFALLLFAIGFSVGAFWQARRSHPETFPPVRQQALEEEWPLTQAIVSRSLQTHSFSTDELRGNSNAEIVWRWLKESLATYPQHRLRLDISDEERYGVILHPQMTLDSAALTSYNKELSKKGMPLLREGKRYLPIEVYRGDLICPNWSGLVDVEEARLVYFAGGSA